MEPSPFGRPHQEELETLLEELEPLRETSEVGIEYGELKGGESLAQSFEFLLVLMKERNARELPTVVHRASHLGLAGWDLRNVCDRASEEEKPLAYRAASARLVLRIVAALEFVGTPRDFVDQLVETYSVCRDCGKKVCTCPLKRTVRGHYTVPPPEGFDDWGLRGWQKHFKALYGTINSQRTLKEMVDQVADETSEAQAALTSLDAALRHGDSEKIALCRKTALNEMGQAYAWTAGFGVHPEVAIHGGPIDLEDLIVRLYGKGCPNAGCGTIPCTKCGPFTYTESRKDTQGLAQIRQEFF